MRLGTHVHVSLDDVVDLRIEGLLDADAQQLQRTHGRLGAAAALQIVHAAVSLPYALQHILRHLRGGNKFLGSRRLNL